MAGNMGRAYIDEEKWREGQFGRPVLVPEPLKEWIGMSRVEMSKVGMSMRTDDSALRSRKYRE